MAGFSGRVHGFLCGAGLEARELARTGARDRGPFCDPFGGLFRRGVAILWVGQNGGGSAAVGRALWAGLWRRDRAQLLVAEAKVGGFGAHKKLASS